MAESSSPAEVDYLDSCEGTVRILEEYVLASGRHLLNQRQCKGLSSKLSRIAGNVRELVLFSGTSITPFRAALENLHRCLEKAEELVRSCADEDWCRAATVQILKESAFGVILKDVGSCYEKIYEVAKSAIQDWKGAPEDLRQSSVFKSAGDGDVRKDELELEKRLNDTAQVEFLNLCRRTVLSVRNAVKSDKVLLNRRQCEDVSSKLCITALNVFQLVSCGGASVERFKLGLMSLYHVLERAKALLSNCAEDDWLAAAVFQIDNENAFRMILLDLSLCYNAVYELAKSTSTNWNNPPKDLRHPSLSGFMPAAGSDVEEDKEDLKERLNNLANGHTKFSIRDQLNPGKISRAQSLAIYLLMKMSPASLDLQVDALDRYSLLLWRKVSEPICTWGSATFLGSGSGASGVLSTTWLGIPCAKKEFHVQDNEGFFLKEAGILAHVKHPYVVNFICCGNGSKKGDGPKNASKKGDRFIAMELMEKSLADLIEEQIEKGAPLGPHVVVDMMAQIARGLCYLHGRGIAHRDLKPGNVVLSSLDGESYYCLKLVDFGMSKTKVEASKVNTMTAHGIGTTGYRAPEVGPHGHLHGDGRAAWFKADVYSFAMTCAHLISLEKPFEEVTKLSELDRKVMNGERPSLPGDCPKEIVALLEKCWSTSPESRPTFGEVCTRLEKFKYSLLKGSIGGNERDKSNVVGYNFIETKIKEEFPHEVMPDVDTIDDGVDTIDDGMELWPKRTIFLSHSGAQKPFVERLWLDLNRENQPAIFDQDSTFFPIGERSASLPFKAVEQCSLAVVVLSKEYLNSKWPMLELCAILKAKRTKNPNLKVLPLFYKLSPSDLDAEDESVRELRLWNGMDFMMYGGSEEAYRKAVVTEITKRVPPVMKYGTEKILGYGRFCEMISSMFEGTRFSTRRKSPLYLGLYGMGGVGKTTLCEAMCSYFQQDCRVCHVELQMDSPGGQVERVKAAIKQLGGVDKEVVKNIHSVCQGFAILKEQLSELMPAVFLAVDNVGDSQSSRDEAQAYLDAVRAPYSRVLVTSRSRTILESMKLYCQPIPRLDEIEASQVFLSVAAPGKYLPSLEPGERAIVRACLRECQFEDDIAVTTSKYHPLILRALGAYFHDVDEDHSMKNWGVALRKEKKLHNSRESKHVNDVLGLNYKTLDDMGKKIFLDVAYMTKLFGTTLYASAVSGGFIRNALYEFEMSSIVRFRGIPEFEARMKVKELQRKLLINESSPGSLLTMHDLYYEFALALIGEEGSKEREWWMGFAEENSN